MKDEEVRMWDLRSSGILCDVDCYFCTDGLAQIIGPIFKASIWRNLPSKPVTWTILSMKGPRLNTTPCLEQSWKPLIHCSAINILSPVKFTLVTSYKLPCMLSLTSLGTVQYHYSHWLGTPYVYHSLPLYNSVLFTCLIVST